MAYNQDQWDKAKAYYEAGLSLAKIKEKTGIARNTISQRAKKEHWEQGKNTDYIEAKVNLEEKKGTVLEQSGTVALSIADDIAYEQIRLKGLVFTGVEKAVKKMTDIIDSGTVEEKINVGDGMQKFEERKINTTDLKNALDGYDKASITLGVNQRHANSQVQINNTNAMQNNNNIKIEDMSQKEISNAYLDLIKK